MKHKMNNAVAVAQEQAPVDRSIQVLLSGLWVANIAFFLYFLLKYGLKLS